MNEFVWVSPQNYLLSKKDWKSDIKKNGYIPILKADLNKFEDSLQHSLKNRFPLVTNNLTSDVNKGDLEIYSEESALFKEGNKLKYKPVDIFLKDSNPLLTFCIGSLIYIESVDKLNILLEEWMQYLKEQSLELHERNELHFVSWSRIFATGFETQNVFIQMSTSSGDYKLYCKFLKFTYELGKKSDRFSISFDDNIHQLIDKQSLSSHVNTKDMTLTLQHIEGMLQELKTSEENSHKDNQLNQATSEEYNIDLTTLSDLPRESLDQLCKDIIGFRSRVFTIEREKMLRDSIEENQQRRKKMIQIFEEISKKQNMDNDSVNGILMMDDSGNEDNGDILYPDDSNLNEDDDGRDIEEKKKVKAKQDSDVRYKKLLNKLKSSSEVRLRNLEVKVKDARNYDNILEKIRPAAIKELLHLGKDIYYDSRRISGNKEKQLDDINREKYGTNAEISSVFDKLVSNMSVRKDLTTEDDIKSLSTIVKTKSDVEQHTDNTDINIALNFNKALGRSSNTLSEKENLDNSATNGVNGDEDEDINKLGLTKAAPDKLPFSDEDLDSRLKELKSSRLVDELIKEYLGVYEEELVDYIFDNLREFRDKNSLFNELKETFDDDAQVIVDKIWNSKELSLLNQFCKY